MPQLRNDAATRIVADRDILGHDVPGCGAGEAAARTDAVLFLVGWAVGVAVFFRHQIAGRFTFTLGDRFDPIIETTILEHWYNFWRGLESFRETAFFFPVRDTLGYNDAYFGYGMLYAPLRALGLDPFLASEGVNVILVGAGFPGMVLCARLVFGLGRRYAIVAGLLFVLSTNIYLQAAHEQLLSVMLAPTLLAVLHLFVRALADGAGRRAMAWGALTAAIHALWLLSTFYMAWFFCLNLVFFAPALAAVQPGAAVTAWRIVRRHCLLLAGLLAFYLALNVPFVLVYGPKLQETGQHSLAESMKGVPAFSDTLNTGEGTLLFRNPTDWLGGEPTALEGEQVSGFAPSTLALFLVGCCFALRDRIVLRERRRVPVCAFALASVASWLCILSFGGASLWPVIHAVVPGAKAIRVVARYQLFLSVPISLVGAYALQRLLPQIHPALGVASIGVLLAGQVAVRPNTRLPAAAEAARLAALPLPPPSCKAFFARRSRDGDHSPDWIDGIYNHNIEAMMFAEYRHIPTINGWDTFTPPNWHLVQPLDQDTYLGQVDSFASVYGVTGLCSLDLANATWGSWMPGPGTDFLVPRPVPPGLGTASCTGFYDTWRPSSLLPVAALDLQGWVTLDPKRPASPDSIGFRVHAAGLPDRIYPSQRVSRPDVALALDNPRLLRSGFQAFIPAAALPAAATVTPALTYGSDVVDCANMPLAPPY